MIAVAFASPHESRDFVAALKTGRTDPRKVVVIHIGVGPTTALAGLQHFWEQHGDARIEGLIGAGFAGGLDPSLAVGTLILAENHPTWLPPARAVLGNRAWVVPVGSVPEVLETPEAKADCTRRTGAAAVDMESTVLSAFCHEKGIPFVALRVISDTPGAPFPVPSAVWFNAATQRPRPFALLAFLLRHPSRVPPFIRFVIAMSRARRVLAEALMDLLAAFARSDRAEPLSAEAFRNRR